MNELTAPTLEELQRWLKSLAPNVTFTTRRICECPVARYLQSKHRGLDVTVIPTTAFFKRRNERTVEYRLLPADVQRFIRGVDRLGVAKPITVEHCLSIIDVIQRERVA